MNRKCAVSAGRSSVRISVLKKAESFCLLQQHTLSPDQVSGGRVRNPSECIETTDSVRTDFGRNESPLRVANRWRGFATEAARRWASASHSRCIAGCRKPTKPAPRSWWKWGAFRGCAVPTKAGCGNPTSFSGPKVAASLLVIIRGKWTGITPLPEQTAEFGRSRCSALSRPRAGTSQAARSPPSRRR